MTTLQPVQNLPANVAAVPGEQYTPYQTGPYNPDPVTGGAAVAQPPFRTLLAPQPIVPGQHPSVGLRSPQTPSIVREGVRATVAPATTPADALPIPALSTRNFPELGVSVQTLARGLDVPWSTAFASDGRVFFSERSGRVRVIKDGVVQAEPVLTRSVGRGEGGMLGIALDPNFDQNHFLYMYYTSTEGRDNRVVRVTLDGDRAVEGSEQVLVSGIQSAGNHNGGRIAFGPDGKLYITSGDAGSGRNSQNLASLNGKILRINSDGSVPTDNPFVNTPDANPRIWSYGHRNPQGLSWTPRGELIASEFGASSNDEINLIRPGQNYGWPTVEGDNHRPPFTPPLAHAGRGPSWAPSGGTYVTSDKVPQFQNRYLLSMLGFGAGAARGLREFTFDDNLNVTGQRVLFQDVFGRVRSIAQGPDGYLYVTTTNRDGRGSPNSESDQLLRIVPLANQ